MERDYCQRSSLSLPLSMLHFRACMEVPQCRAVVPETRTSLGTPQISKREGGGVPQCCAAAGADEQDVETKARPAAGCLVFCIDSPKAPAGVLKVSLELLQLLLQMKAALAALTGSRRRTALPHLLLPLFPPCTLPPVYPALFPRWLSFSISL